VEKNENFWKKMKKNIDLSEKKSQKNGNFGKKK
jgi:plasmid maintenance system antidote protein VapI